jgi:hypothetical protein
MSSKGEQEILKVLAQHSVLLRELRQQIELVLPRKAESAVIRDARIEMLEQAR